MVSVASVTVIVVPSASARSFTGVPAETVTILFGASTWLSRALIVTTPPLDMFPAAIVSVVAVLSV